MYDGAACGEGHPAWHPRQHFTCVWPDLKNYLKSREVRQGLRWDASRENIWLFSIDQKPVKEHLVKSTTVFHSTLKTSVGELRGMAARGIERKKSNKNCRIKDILIFVWEYWFFSPTGLPTSTLSLISLEKGKRKKTAYTRKRETEKKEGVQDEKSKIREWRKWDRQQKKLERALITKKMRDVKEMQYIYAAQYANFLYAWSTWIPTTVHK